MRKDIANRKSPKVEPMVDGYTGFLYFDKVGHSDISVTLNVYTHVDFDDAKAEDYLIYTRFADKRIY